MRISLIQVKDFQRISQIEIRPGSRNLVLIAGKNRQGKSSLMRAMSAALGGGKEKPSRPVRAGAETAEILIELDDGELVVKRKFTEEGGTSLEVRSGKFGKVTSPQSILDGIVGTRFMDPLSFSRLSEKAQREKLLEVVDIGIDLEAHAAKRRATFASRTDVNRETKRISAELAGIVEPGPVPEMMDSAELLDQIDNLAAQLKASTSAAETLSDELRDLDASKAAALAKTKMPVAGLGVDDNHVTLNGFPLSQASGAEQLQTSLAIAASTSPELRDIWIEDGALLDGDSLELVNQFAVDNDLRVWLERVGETDDDCVILEDGSVRESTAALEAKLSKHDWWFSRSDDRHAHDRGRKSYQALCMEYQKLPLDQARALWISAAPDEFPPPGARQ